MNKISKEWTVEGEKERERGRIYRGDKPGIVVSVTKDRIREVLHFSVKHIVLSTAISTGSNIYDLMFPLCDTLRNSVANFKRREDIYIYMCVCVCMSVYAKIL